MNLFHDVAVSLILGLEGGYVNDPNDPGGETKWGISKAAYPRVDIKNLTRDGAIAIYEQDYWRHTGGKLEDIDPDIAIIVFDWGVNSGVKTAVMKLQEALHVAQDGVIGPKTRAALQDAKGQALAVHLLAERAMFYTRLKTWPKFGLGWTRRLFNLAACVFGTKDSLDAAVLDEVIEKLQKLRAEV